MPSWTGGRGFHRQRDSSGSSHDRARLSAAERLDGPLDADEVAWLEAHLAGCRPCRHVAAAYEAQRAELRAARERTVAPPRDLWARTAAAIERESRRSATLRRVSPGSALVLAGAFSLAIVATATLLSLPPGRPLSSDPGVSAASSGGGSLATPIPVLAGAVAYLASEPGGGFSVYFVMIDRVCPGVVGDTCTTTDANRAATLSLTSQPRSIVMSPRQDLVVVMGQDTATDGGDILAYAVPPTPGRATPTPPSTPTTSSTPTATATPDPADLTPEPTKSAVSPPSDPTDAPPTPAEPTGGATDPPAGSGDPTAPPSDSAQPTDVPPSPTATAAAALAIASGVVVLDESAAYSADGQWFAFSAWPADASHGPDVYLWRVGDPTATPMTSDHRSVFASWLGNRLLVSRIEPATEAPADSPDPDASVDPAEPGIVARSFILDPETGLEDPLGAAPGWRPAPAPDGLTFVYWDGTLGSDAERGPWRPRTGRLVMAQRGPDVPVTAPSPDASVVVDGTGEPAAGESGPAFVGELRQVIAEGPIGDFDVRWDASGSRVGIWMADPKNPAVGSLSVYELKRAADGTLRPAVPLLVNSPALPGFSIGNGRIAWASPPESDGSGSHIEVLAWSTSGVGSIETALRSDGLLVLR